MRTPGGGVHRGACQRTNEFSHTNAAERVREDMASAITALNFLATSIGQLAALHESDEEEAIITEGASSP